MKYMKKTMKAVAILSKGNVGIVDIPIPEPGDYECLTKITYCGICNGTDLKLIENKVGDKQTPYPTILGHESVGYIVKVGKKVRNWKVGDRVVSPIGTIAPESGYSSSFGQMTEYGITHDIKTMTEDGISLGKQPPIPTYRGNLIPEGVSFRDAVMLLTFKENYSALLNFGFKKGKSILVIGDGPVAMGIACSAGALGASYISVIGHHDNRLEHIKKCIRVDKLVNSKNEDPLEVFYGFRFDLIVDAVGNVKNACVLSKLCNDGGTLGLYGVVSKENANINIFDVPNHINIHPLNWPYHEHWVNKEVCDLVMKGVFKPSDYYSHVIPMEDVNKGFVMIRNREAFKVIIQMPGVKEV
jgi:threonine dehydrogenase-like Zn-dependent dehydrogenase